MIALRKIFQKKNQFIIKFTSDFSLSEFYSSAIKIVHYGWKKEAVPIVQEKKVNNIKILR